MLRQRALLLTLSTLCFVSVACTLAAAGPAPTALVPPTATLLLSPTAASPTSAAAASATPPAFPTVAGGATASPSVTQVVPTPIVGTQVPAAAFCADGQVTTLINSFKTALQTSNGTLLASLVSPAHGMDARLYRDGTVVTYDQQHAQFLFETTYSIDWGAAPASGLETTGSFHEIIVPALLDVFNKTYTLTCNQVQVGGTTYHASWPYPGVSFYSAYYPGTQANANMDWHTWLLGIQHINGHPYLYAIMQFQWEP